MEEQAFVLCENLVKIYKVAELEVVALQGLDLVVVAGEMMALVGPSWSREEYTAECHRRVGYTQCWYRDDRGLGSAEDERAGSHTL